MLSMDLLLRDAAQQGASDLHICVDQPPVFRIDGKLIRQSERALTAEDTELLLRQILPKEKLDDFKYQGELDFSYALDGVGRFRVNAFRQRGSVAIALRAIPFRVRTLYELGLPDVLTSLCEKPHGLVLVTGPTGSGKSTTLAGMLDHINTTRDTHIITLEDPIEYMHTHKRSIINQREVGNDTLSFARGLRAALREDPDVILVGEMRDLETIQIALQAAETGHLVFATLHTNDAPTTVDRIIDVFPAEQQQQVRIQLGAAIQGVISQRLFRRTDRPGRIAALEILVATSAVRNLIREGKTHQLMSNIQTGARLGMRTMESSVRALYEQRIIAQEDFHLFSNEYSTNTTAGGVAPARV